MRLLFYCCCTLLRRVSSVAEMGTGSTVGGVLVGSSFMSKEAVSALVLYLASSIGLLPVGGRYGALASLCCYCVHDQGTADRKRTVDGIKVVCMTCELGWGRKKATSVGNSVRSAQQRGAFRRLGLGTRRLVGGTRPCVRRLMNNPRGCSSHDLGDFLEATNAGGS